jgi:ketopantoate reductase
VHIVVMGSGAVSGYFGGKLLRGVAQATMVARGPHLQAIRRAGVSGQLNQFVHVRVTTKPKRPYERAESW